MKTLLALLLLSLPIAACSSSKGSGGTDTSTSTTTTTSQGPQASVQLNWAASTGSPSGYYVEQSGDGTTFSLAQTVSTNSALIGSLTVGHTYYFRVRAYNSGGYSGYSNTFTVTP